MKHRSPPPSSDEASPVDSGLGAAEFEALRALIYELTGISLNDSKRSLVEARLARRLRSLGMASYAEYCEFVRSDEVDDDEVRELINCVTTNKTDFFREPHHFEFLRSTVFPELEQRAARGAPKRVRLWSAACSSGEEPYTLAMTALEHFGGKGWQIEILATDIDTDVLARAKAGVYPAERAETIPGERLRRFFLRGKGEWVGHYKVRPELSQCVTFRRLNFMDADWGIDTKFDAIFCRNVVIYFDRRTQEALFRRMHALLDERAYLMIGHSESLSFLSNLFEALAGTVYRKRNTAAALPAVAMPSRSTRSDPSAPRADLKRQTITIGEVFASDTPAAVRTVLGSCVSACLWDPLAKVGGMNHILLPEAPGGEEHSSRYGVHAMELLINAIMHKGGERRRLRAKIFGAAHVLAQVSYAGSAPQRNAAFLKQFLEREQIPIVATRLGGSAPLEVVFHTHDGRALVRPVGGTLVADLARTEHQYGQEISRKVVKPTDEGDVTLF